MKDFGTFAQQLDDIISKGHTVWIYKEKPAPYLTWYSKYTCPILDPQRWGMGLVFVIRPKLGTTDIPVENDKND